ncbi:hypothetical protein HYALB_00003999 [Hymenoscyphus albidus]|uniref:Aminodeoxychorismate lyase n=1 Tax=Hymenoscyphus albidus TaxID=595503 RepID=A0A9N9Q285_9HELO|nr:hypothetical protein HYALB_00003999 [Hymenoscyphus albidus]
MSEPAFALFTSLRYDPILLTHAPNTQDWEPPATAPSPYYMLPLHRDRLVQAAEHFDWPLAVAAVSGPAGFKNLLSRLETSIDSTSTTPLRVRVVLTKEGTMTIETSPTPPVELENLFPSRIPPPASIREAVPSVSPLTGGALTSPGGKLYGDPPLTNPFIICPDTIRTPPSSYTSYKTTARDMYDGARSRLGIKEWTERREVLLLSTKDGEIMEGTLTTLFFWREGSWVTPAVSSGGQIGTTRRWALEKGLCKEGVLKVDSLLEGEECWISNGVRGFHAGVVKLA